MCNNSCSCQGLSEIIEIILKLQCNEDKVDSFKGCDKPFLGPCPIINCFNTRPVQLYSCCTGELWTFPYTLDETSGTSTVFRIEDLCGCCCTCRVLAPNLDTTETNPYVATDSFFTINLNCISSIKCLEDIYLPCI